MTQNRSGTPAGGGLFALFFFSLWIVHWLLSGVERTSDAGFADGVVQGAGVILFGVAHTFGVDVGWRDHLGGGTYELGLALGFALQLKVHQSLSTAGGELAFGGGDRKKALPLLFSAVALVVGLAIAVPFAGHLSPPNITPGDVPLLLGFIPGVVWHYVALVFLDLYALSFVLMLAALVYGLSKASAPD